MMVTGETVGERKVVAGPRWLGFGLLAVWGPGLVVMLADTEAGSLVTAAPTGTAGVPGG